MPTPHVGFRETDLINMVSGGLHHVTKTKRRHSAKKVSFKKERPTKRGSVSKEKRDSLKRRESQDIGCKIRHFIDEVEDKFITHRGSVEEGALLRSNSARLRKLIQRDHPLLVGSPQKQLPKASTLPHLFAARKPWEPFRRGSARVNSPTDRKSPLIVLPDLPPQDNLPIRVVVSPSPHLGSPHHSPTLRRGSLSPLRVQSPHLATPTDRGGSGKWRSRSASLWDVGRFEEETSRLRSGKRVRSGGRLRVEWGLHSEDHHG